LEAGALYARRIGLGEWHHSEGVLGRIIHHPVENVFHRTIPLGLTHKWGTVVVVTLSAFGVAASIDCAVEVDERALDALWVTG
jgi:hypothetical protein